MRMKIAALSFFSVVKRQPNSATCKSYKIKEELDKTNSFKHVSANTHPNCYNYNPKSKKEVIILWYAYLFFNL